MALNSIITNIAAYSAQGNIGKASSSASASIARLSSGNRIVKASDDVAALSIGTSLRTGVTTLKTALLNASQGSSLLQVADGALAQLSEILQRQKAIAVQAGSGSVGSAERGFLNQEFQNLAAEIDRIAGTTNFNNVTLINGGLGSKTRLVSTNAQAALFDPATVTNATAGFSDASTFAIQAFNRTTGDELNGVAAAGEVELVAADGTTPLANGAYLGVNSAVYGQFSNFRVIDVVYGVSVTIGVTLNGVEFTGTAADNATSIVVSNGETRIGLGTSSIDVANEGEVQNTLTDLYDNFKNTVIMHTMNVQGINFAGTRLEGTVGLATTGVAMVRLSDPTRADINNFRYVGNTGAANSNQVAVDINGQTFTARGIADAVAGADHWVFEAQDGQALIIDFTGLDADFTNIRTNATERNDLINALNIGFSRGGSGLSFQVGATADDSLRVQLGSATTVNLYNGQSLSVASAEDAAIAVEALDVAIQKITSLRADVGALQSRFNFASANLESSIQNQDAARGTLLDTDVAGESTMYATAQVQLQAGIAVLAQANLLPQNLLKLIG